MSNGQKYVAIQPAMDSVEVIGTKSEVLDYLFDNFTVKEVKENVEIYELGARVSLSVKLEKELEPA